MELPINKVIQGDVLEVLKSFPDEFIDCIITSPPYYGLRDYGVDGQIGLEKSLNEYLDRMLLITAELKRVLKKTGTMWWNHGDSYGGGQFHFDFKMKDNPEQKKYYSEDSIKERQFKGPKKNYMEKSLMLQAHRLAIRMVDEQGWILRNQIIWHKPNVMPSSVKDRFTVDFEPIFFFSKSKKYWFEPQYEPHTYFEKRPAGVVRNREYGYEGKYSLKNDGWKTPANQGLRGGGELTKKYRENLNPDGSMGNPLGRNKRSVWKIATKPFKEAHFATFPETLIETPIKAGCPEMICKKCGNAREKMFNTEYDWQTKGKTRGTKQQSGQMATIPGHATKKVTEVGYTECGCNAGWEAGIVLDPFMGAGTVGVVAKKLGRNYIGIELNPKYIEIAERRINQIPESLFNNVNQNVSQKESMESVLKMGAESG